MFGVPFLHNRFKSLAIGLVVLFLFSFSLPVAWFGKETASKFFNELPDIVNERMFENIIARDHLTGQDLQISISGIIGFTSVLMIADPSRYEHDWKEMHLYEVVQTPEGTERRRVRLSSLCQFLARSER